MQRDGLSLPNDQRLKFEISAEQIPIQKIISKLFYCNADSYNHFQILHVECKLNDVFDNTMQ